MPYFQDHYLKLTYPQADGAAGLYRAQIGAIHSIGAHFTLHDQPAIVTMPTGSGKTAVLMMAPFVLKSRRVLVITPGRMVREQIAEDFKSLSTLKKATVLPADLDAPNVGEVKSKITDVAGWEALRDYDVVVSTPNCVSPGHPDIPAPPDDLFDLVLIDEAHHSPARTWAELLDALAATRRVLFTATPFRKDKGEIRGRFIYTYPVAKAFEDGIFGRIAYVPAVRTNQEDSDDLIVAKTAEATLKADRANGLNHRLMVRTDRITRASELLAFYEEHTELKLDLVHGQTPNRKVKDILQQLEAGELDGVVCVNMLAEGFNFPRLKLAAIHKPHKSLEVTLQFIGRFARTNAPDIGEAKFIATQSELDIEGERLFVEGAVWQSIVENLSHGKVDEEERVREGIDEFTHPDAIDEDLKDLSLYSLHPRSHVKIYDTEGVDVDLNVGIPFPRKYELRYENITTSANTLAMILRESQLPKWSAGDQIVDRTHLLVVVCYFERQSLLFVNTSQTIPGLYDLIVDSVAPEARPLSTGEVRRVVRNVKNQRIFNLGLRNVQTTNTAESYRIIAGSDAHVRPSDARLYVTGHVYLSGVEEAENITIGYSAGSKVWATQQERIPLLREWCQLLADKIRTAGDFVTNTTLDSLAQGEIIDELPDNVVVAQWNKRAFLLEDPVAISYQGDDQRTHRGLLIDLELSIDRANSDDDHLRIVVRGESISLNIDFSLSEDADEMFEAPDGNGDRVVVNHGAQEDSLVDFLNFYYLSFYTADGALLLGNELWKPSEDAIPIDLSQIDDSFDWNGTDIEEEITNSATGRSIHAAVADHLRRTASTVVLSDHGTGEIADFLEINRADDYVYLTLYHCKGSSEPRAGARVEDVYEVCGQAEKSVVWRSVGRIERRLLGRLDKLDYFRGDEQALRTILEQAKSLRQVFSVVVVQPGISKQRLSRALAENLGAVNDHVLSSGFKPLKILSSP